VIATTTRSDRILLVLLLACLALASGLSPITNYDYWWHLKTGALILEAKEVPRADPFSFTAKGEPWVDHEWLFQVASYLRHVALGPAVLVALKALFVLGLALLMARHARREGNSEAGIAILTSAALVGAAFRFDDPGHREVPPHLHNRSSPGNHSQLHERLRPTSQRHQALSLQSGHRRE